MADFNEIKEKVISTLGMVADSAKELAEKAADKTKSAARIAKLSMEINAEKDSIKKAYLEIGKLYYEMNRDNPDGFFAQLCDEITVANAEIAAKEAEIADLKANGIGGADVEVEFSECADAEGGEDACGCETEGDACGCEEPKAEEDACCCDAPAAEDKGESADETPCCCKKSDDVDGGEDKAE